MRDVINSDNKYLEKYSSNDQNDNKYKAWNEWWLKKRKNNESLWKAANNGDLKTIDKLLNKDLPAD